jgi:hypothetical protein
VAGCATNLFFVAFFFLQWRDTVYQVIVFIFRANFMAINHKHNFDASFFVLEAIFFKRSLTNFDWARL